MRQRDPIHQSQLNIVAALSPAEVVRRIQVRDVKHADFLASEVIATLLRERDAQPAGVETVAVTELNRRIQMLAGKRMVGVKNKPEVQKRGDSALQDAIDYIWEKFFEDMAVLSNSEVRFAVFVRDRFDDFIRHLRTHKNSAVAIDAMEVLDEDGNATPWIDTVEDLNTEGPEARLERKQHDEAVLSALMNLPTIERNAFYFRCEYKYDWPTVAKLLGCSVTTAQKHYAASVRKLKGVSE